MPYGAGSTGMKCLGRLSAPFAKPGYFISPIDPTIGLKCPLEEACLGGPSGNSSCGPGHAGKRCTRCTEGHYQLYHRCNECGVAALIWIFSVILPVAGIIRIVSRAPCLPRGTLLGIL